PRFGRLGRPELGTRARRAAHRALIRTALQNAQARRLLSGGAGGRGGRARMKRYQWRKLLKKSRQDPELEPPIWLGDHSNGEYYHRQTPRDRLIRKLILERADEGARKPGIERRQFLASSMGMATSLAVINYVAGCGGGSRANKDGS